MLNIIYSESILRKTRVYEWYKHFPDGCEDIIDEECPSISTTYENAEKVIKKK